MEKRRDIWRRAHVARHILHAMNQTGKVELRHEANTSKASARSQEEWCCVLEKLKK